MSNEREQVTARIRKLLNLADGDGATQGEIDNAMRFARRLMDAHHVTEDDVRSTADVHERAAAAEVMDRQRTETSGTRIASWEGSLAVLVCDIVGGVGAYKDGAKAARNDSGTARICSRTGRPMRRSGLMFYGVAGDVQAAQGLYDQLAELVGTMARLRYGGALQGAGRCYADGFVRGLRIAVNDSRKADRSDANSTALMVRRDAIVHAKRQRADVWVAGVLGGKLRKGSTSRNRTHDAGAYHSGKADGMKHGAPTASRSGTLPQGSRKRLQ